MNIASVPADSIQQDPQAAATVDFSSGQQPKGTKMTLDKDTPSSSRRISGPQPPAASDLALHPCPSSPKASSVVTTPTPAVVTATKSPRATNNSSSSITANPPANMAALSPRPTNNAASSSRGGAGGAGGATTQSILGLKSPMPRNVTFSPRPHTTALYHPTTPGSPKVMPIMGGVKNAGSGNTDHTGNATGSVVSRSPKPASFSPRRSLTISPTRSRASGNGSTNRVSLSPRRKVLIFGSPSRVATGPGGAAGASIGRGSGSSSINPNSATKQGSPGSIPRKAKQSPNPNFTALGSPKKLIPSSSTSITGGPKDSADLNNGPAAASRSPKPIIVATTTVSPKPTLTASAVSSRSANLGSAQRYRIIASPGRQDAVLALSALFTQPGGGSGGRVKGKPRKISLGGDMSEEKEKKKKNVATVVRTDDQSASTVSSAPPAVITCDAPDVDLPSVPNHLVTTTPQGKHQRRHSDPTSMFAPSGEPTKILKTAGVAGGPQPCLFQFGSNSGQEGGGKVVHGFGNIDASTSATSPGSNGSNASPSSAKGGEKAQPDVQSAASEHSEGGEKDDGKLKRFIEATHEIRSKDLIKSPRRSPQKAAKSTPRSQPKNQNKKKRTSSRKSTGQLPTLPADSHVIPTTLAEQRQKEKFYAYYYQKQYSQHQRHQQQFSPQYSSPYYQHGYWPGYDYGTYSQGYSSASYENKSSSISSRAPYSPVPRPPEIIAEKIQTAVKLSQKRGHDQVSMDIMEAGNTAEKSSTRIAAKAAKKLKESESTVDKDVDAKKASPTTQKKKKTVTKKSSPTAKTPIKTTSRASAKKKGPQVGEKGYKRADKSLGKLCERFVEHFKSSHGVEITVDEAAADLDVERRRIYDIINILEALRVVRRICKNTYTWHGPEVLPLLFANMQQNALSKWHDRAVANGLVDPSSSNKRARKNSDVVETGKSMAVLTCDFVNLFLAGDTVITVTEAADRVLGTKSELYTEGQIFTEKQKAEAKAMKSKIRRLYDIANVLSSINVIDKENCGSSFQKNNEESPQFRWIYPLPPKAFLKVLQDHGHLIPSDPMAEDPVIDITPYVPKGCKSKKNIKKKSGSSEGKNSSKIPHSASKKKSKK